MEKQTIDTLKLDIEIAETFFEKTGQAMLDTYKCIDEDIDKVNEYGAQNIFLFIPAPVSDEPQNDMYTMFMN